ncbi:MAG: PD-(D/E)XK nuclease family protein, partial [Pseudomonadota bacterium]
SDIPKADKGSWYELSVNAFEAMDGVAPIDLPWGDRGLRVAAPQTAQPDVGAVEAARADEPPPAWLFDAVGPSGDRPNRANEARRPSANATATAPTGLAHSVRRKAAIARGEAIHALLQILAGLPRASWTSAAGPALAALPEEERAGALAEATAVLEAPDWSRLFGPGSHGEVPLVRTAGTGPGGAGARLLMGRPDRIVVTPSLVEIVDFKSDRPAPKPGAPPPAAYLRQLAGYRAAIADLYPGRTIACALLWTAALRFDAIPDAFLDAAGA